jgi:hypothetical protein
MRARPAQSKNWPGPKGAGPFDSPDIDQRADTSGALPPGWVRRGSGLIVPTPRGPRRRRTVVGLLVAAVLLISPVANVVSDVSRAANDVVTFVRVMLDVDSTGSVTTSPQSQACLESQP